MDDNLAFKEASFCSQTELIEAILALKLIESIAAEFDAKAALIEEIFKDKLEGIAVAVMDGKVVCVG